MPPASRQERGNGAVANNGQIEPRHDDPTPVKAYSDIAAKLNWGCPQTRSRRPRRASRRLVREQPVRNDLTERWNLSEKRKPGHMISTHHAARPRERIAAAAEHAIRLTHDLASPDLTDTPGGAPRLMRGGSSFPTTGHAFRIGEKSPVDATTPTVILTMHPLALAFRPTISAPVARHAPIAGSPQCPAAIATNPARRRPTRRVRR